MFISCDCTHVLVALSRYTIDRTFPLSFLHFSLFYTLGAVVDVREFLVNDKQTLVAFFYSPIFNERRKCFIGVGDVVRKQLYKHFMPARYKLNWKFS